MGQRVGNDISPHVLAFYPLRAHVRQGVE